ncbi:M23 family metallopeptidase [Chitinispirillales bacterium ANBcel5]|uniref:M23 family metallopeptidase n=1 Tax=Cellulosispirillum alkaliphilum TaxID=3039283 RepID=UPI002A512090|nr:M23 family metallopeptidase [Chitinispirillales bacterium ANBcel5]
MKRNYWTFFLISSDKSACKRIATSSFLRFCVLFILILSISGYIRMGYLAWMYHYQTHVSKYEVDRHLRLVKKDEILTTWLRKMVCNLEYDDRVTEILDQSTTHRVKNKIIPVHNRYTPDLENTFGNYCSNSMTVDSLPYGYRDTISITIQSEKSPYLPSIVPAMGTITSFFGKRSDPLVSSSSFHNGIDIASSVGTPVRATAKGDVIFSGYFGTFGKTVMIEHKQSGYKTLYAHLHRTSVKKGDGVKKGEQIGLMGSTGRSTGPHLHYEVHFQGNIVDPLEFMLPRDVIVD